MNFFVNALNVISNSSGQCRGLRKTVKKLMLSHFAAAKTICCPTNFKSHWRRRILKLLR